MLQDERNGTPQSAQTAMPRMTKSSPMFLRKGALAIPLRRACTLSNVSMLISGW
ncbi:hypothetical protein [Mesorhizobium sp. CN2-181]|uniref:hypothetical protein n=1 Tax=Mesorhizobium yinganensis TaxID=3157707 RepID=UPI0032B8174E